MLQADLANLSQDEESGEEGGQNQYSRAALTGASPEEQEKGHLLRRAQLQRDLQELNKRLLMKEDLAKQMVNNEDQMKEIRTQYQV